MDDALTTETLDKIYLEWAQFTNARTSREIALIRSLRNLVTLFESNIQSDAPEQLAAALEALSAAENDVTRAVPARW